MRVRFSMLVVLVIIGLNVWFAREVFAIMRDTSIEPTVITPLWFAFTTGELWCLKDIKKTEIKKTEVKKETDKGSDNNDS